MPTAYIKAAMKRAKFTIVDETNPFFGEIPQLKGVWANEPTLDAAHARPIWHREIAQARLVEV